MHLGPSNSWGPGSSEDTHSCGKRLPQLDGKVLDKPSKKGLSLCARVKSFLFVDASSEAHPDLGLEACSDENKARLMVSLVVVPRKSKAMMTLMLFRSHFEPLNPCALDPVVAAGQRGKSYIPFSGEYNLNIDSVDQQEQEYILSSSDDSVLDLSQHLHEHNKPVHELSQVRQNLTTSNRSSMIAKFVSPLLCR